MKFWRSFCKMFSFANPFLDFRILKVELLGCESSTFTLQKLPFWHSKVALSGAFFMLFRGCFRCFENVKRTLSASCETSHILRISHRRKLFSEKWAAFCVETHF